MFKKINFLYIAIVVLIIFGIGISVGLNFDTWRKGFLEKETKALDMQITDFVVTEQIISNLASKSCASIKSYLAGLDQQSQDLGSSLEKFENKGLVTDESYIILRSNYYLLEIQYWLNTERYKKCDPELTTILFFHGKNDDSTKQGFVLGELREENMGKVFIFSFGLDGGGTNAVKLLESIYNITGTPSLVINSEKVVNKFADLNTLRNITNLK